MLRISLALCLATALVVASDQDISSIIVAMVDDTPGSAETGFSVTSAAAADAAGDLGKPIGHRLRRLPRNPGEPLQQQLDRLNSMKGIKYAVPDLRVHPAAVRPADAAIPQKLPSGGSRGVFRQYQWAMSRIGMQSAWNIATGASSKEAAVTVCIVDSGIDDKHPALVDNLAEGLGMNAVNGEDYYDVSDVLGHGTTLAGVIAGSGAKSGPVGVNWGNINLLTCKFMSPAGYGTTSDAVQCLDYCLDKGAHIISASWTTGNLPNPPLEEAVARTADAGALLVVAAGNFGQDMRKVPYYPQVYSRKYPNMLVVAASDDYDEHIFFSNWDTRTVQLSAPGVMIFTTAVGGMYNWTSGTSIAAPFVSGAAALLQAVSQDRLNRTLTAQELKSLIMDSAERLAALAGKTTTGGRLRVDWALQSLLSKALSPATPCIARPGQRSSKCKGGKGGGEMPTRRNRSLVEDGEVAAASVEQRYEAVLGDEETLPRVFRSVEMQRELAEQWEQQRRQLRQQGHPGQQQAAAAGAGPRRSTRRLQAGPASR